MKQYAMYRRRFKRLEALFLRPKKFRRAPDPSKRHGPVKVYSEEEIFLFKVRHYGAMFN